MREQGRFCAEDEDATGATVLLTPETMDFMDLRALADFVLVADSGGFTPAERKSGQSKATLSRRVRDLEAELGVRLFDRDSRNLRLTEEGERFYELCRPGVELVSEAVTQLGDLKKGPPTGRLRISSTVGLGRKFVAPLLVEFCRLHPTIEAELVLEDRTVDLAKDGFDVAIRNGRLDDSEIIARKLAPMQMLVCGSPGYFADHPPPSSIDDLATHRFVNFRLGSGRIYEWEFVEHGGRRTFRPPAGLTFSDAELVRLALEAGMGLAQLPAYQLAESIRSGALDLCLQDLRVPDFGHYLCYLSRRHTPPRISVFVEFLLLQFSRIDLTVVRPPPTDDRPSR